MGRKVTAERQAQMEKPEHLSGIHSDPEMT